MLQTMSRTRLVEIASFVTFEFTTKLNIGS